MYTSFWKDPVERPVTIYHVLKLFQSGQATDHNSLMKNQRTVVSEFYDEIIFQDPTQYIQPLLTTTRPMSLGAYKHETDFEDKKKTTIVAIKEGRTKIQAEISDMKAKLELAKDTTVKFKEEIMKVQKERGLELTIF